MKEPVPPTSHIAVPPVLVMPPKAIVAPPDAVVAPPDAVVAPPDAVGITRGRPPHPPCAKTTIVSQAIEGFIYVQRMLRPVSSGVKRPVWLACAKGPIGTETFSLLLRQRMAQSDANLAEHAQETLTPTVSGAFFKEALAGVDLSIAGEVR